MSKQLLHAYQSHVVIAALNDRAFAILKDESSASSTTAVLVELMAPKQKEGDDGASEKKSDEGEGGVDGGEESAGQSKEEQDGEKQKSKKKQKQSRSDQRKNNPLEIQSVRCEEIGDNIWLAVSREDKSLSLYSIASDGLHDNDKVEGGDEQQQTTAKSVYPTITYNLPKRARCLAFCSVPSTSDQSNDCHVIIAGDLSGDAIAFPVPTTGDAGASDAKKATTRRLLLGHTASMITGLNVVHTTGGGGGGDKAQQQHKMQFILTADRDEKIRVSCFPETHIIHGYLLGHSSFISTMDAVLAKGAFSSGASSSDDNGDGKGRALCITGSGDGTVRLWDYQLCREVGMVPVVLKKCSEENENEADTKMPAGKNNDGMDEVEQEEEEGNVDDDNFDEDCTDDESIDNHAIAVPISVALSANAENVVVARDGIDSIDVHPIPPPPLKSASPSISLLLSKFVSLHKKQTLECPSQPLAVMCLSDGSVLVLAREPDYLLHFQCTESLTSEAAEYNNISSASPFSVALQQAVKSLDIIMPTTTLERDDDGEWKLQKNKVNDSAGGDNAKNQTGDGDNAEEPSTNKSAGLHWNDAGRKETAKQAEQRRRKRRRGDAKKEEKVAGK